MALAQHGSQRIGRMKLRILKSKDGFTLIEGAPTDDPIETMKRERTLWEQYQPT